MLEHVEKTAEARGDWKIADDNREGVRVSVLDGWFLIRMSLHDPLLPINIESDSAGDVRKIAAMLAEVLGGCADIDLTPLTEAAK